MTLEFPKGAFGQLLQRRALRAVRDINRKSLAKIVAEGREEVMELLPFVLHPAFLLRVALSTFGGGLRPFEKGVVLSVESEGLCESGWLEQPEGI